MPGSSESVEVGETYRMTLNFHCGIKYIRFDQREWRAEKPLLAPPDKQAWPDRTPVDVAYVDQNTLRLTVDDEASAGAGEVVMFHPSPERAERCR